MTIGHLTGKVTSPKMCPTNVWAPDSLAPITYRARRALVSNLLGKRRHFSATEGGGSGCGCLGPLEAIACTVASVLHTCPGGVVSCVHNTFQWRSRSVRRSWRYENPDHMAAWRDYLVGQMHEQYGVAKQEAQKTVARWLRSLGQRPAASEAQPIPEAVRIRNQRPPSSRGLRTRPSARQTRAARA
jgi:hypothetical protein